MLNTSLIYQKEFRKPPNCSCLISIDSLQNALLLQVYVQKIKLIVKKFNGYLVNSVKHVKSVNYVNNAKFLIAKTILVV